MSGKRRRDVVRNEDLPPDDDDILEGGNGTSVSNPNYTVEELSDDNLEYFDAESIEVQASDVLTIEEVTDNSCFEHNSQENLEDEILYEFPTELDEGNCNQLPQTYFDNTDNFCVQENANICGIKEAHSFFRINEKQKSKVLKKKKNKEDIVSESDWENVQTASTKSSVKNKKEELKGKKATSLELHTDICQNIERKIFDFNCFCEVSELNNLKERFKCPEHSSDEFADFEDSSASESFETYSEQKTYPAVSTKDVKSNQRHNVTHNSGSKSRLIPVASSSSSENNIPASKLGAENLPSASKENGESPGTYFSQGNAKRVKTTSADNSAEGKSKFRGGMSTTAELPDQLDGEHSSSTTSKNFVFPNSYFVQGSSKRIKTLAPAKRANKLRGDMSTIVEVPEENEISIAPVQSHSRPNPLKIKSKVGYRKDRCNVCNVRLGLCAIKCRCGGYYCAKHRYDKEHDCTYDYRTMGAEEIRKNNPRIIAEKVRKL